MLDLFLKRKYIDPFVEDQTVNHIEIIELQHILHYSKRTATNQFEVQYNIHKFVIKGNMEETLKKCNLSIYEYLELLTQKSHEIKEKFEYTNEEEKRTANSGEEIAKILGIENDFNNNEEKYKKLFDNYIVNPY